MRQLFVFTAGDPGARAHLAESIEHSIDPHVAKDVLGVRGNDVLSPIFDREGGLWAWGAVPTDRNRSFWERMAVGDWVLCVYENRYHYVARVALKLEHEGLARRVWGNTTEGKTWSLMYFLTRPRRVERTVDDLAKYLNDGYRGFTRIGDERAARIEAAFGSLDLFVENAVIGAGDSQSTEPEQTTACFLIRSNVGSEYTDEPGSRYHFTSTVPNSRALSKGGKVVVDRKTSAGPVLIGYGDLDPAQRDEREGKTHFVSAFRTWHPISSRVLTAQEKSAVHAVKGFNVQHAVRPITCEVFEMLIGNQESPTTPQTDLRRAADSFAKGLREAGVLFGAQHDGLVRTFIASLATKPLAILTGLSGSGKTQIAMRLGEWLGGRVLTTPVRPDWTGAEALFGYEDGLKPAPGGRAAWVVPAALKFMLSARDNPERLHLLILDEMNLAHVERYFADALSGMESEQACLPNLICDDDGCWRIKQGADSQLPFPKNLWVVGTVNVDETTYMFSPKVLDRANTFEFRVKASDLAATGRKPKRCPPGDTALVRGLLEISCDPEWHLRKPASFGEELSAKLHSLHSLLARYGYEFGHRTYFESLRFAAMAEQAGVGQLPDILDRIVIQKILPRLHGARRRLELPLLALLHFCGETPENVATDAELPKLRLEERADPAQLPLSYDKTLRMLKSLRSNQFVSFTE